MSFRHLVLLCVAVATTLLIVVAQGAPANNFNAILGEELPSLTRNVIADPNIGRPAATSLELTEPSETAPVAIDPSSPEIPPLEIPVPPPRNDRPPTTVPSVPTIRTPSPAGDNIPRGAVNHAGRSLTPTERSRIATFLQSKGISLFSPFTPPNSARFILHDTAGVLSQSFLERERRENRGPLGLGVSIYAPRNSEGVVARPNFYELRRPTTTKFEKAEDILSQSTREGYFRRIWRAAKSAVRQDALDSALNGLGLTEAEMSSERRKATQQLNGGNEKGFTTATWTAEKICDRYSEDQSIALTGDLATACNATAEYFRTRNQRVRESVPIEILQVGTRSQRGNQNSCTAFNSNLQPLPNPPYSQTQYNTTIVQYLRSAAIAGKYPEITTHFLLDKFDRVDAHCDPRCFNVNKVYTSIADLMGHDRGSKYGITPSYGTSSRDNIWWNDRVCYGAPPQ